jgi:CheY-like chemotaxis protein
MLTGVRVLLVDDSDDDLDLYAYGLGLHHAEVSLARTVREGLESFERVAPDVVVSDVTLDLPEGGYALVRAIRALGPERGGARPAVALTGRAFDADRARALEAGFTEHCPKPLTPAELVAVIARLIGRAARPAGG